MEEIVSLMAVLQYIEWFPRRDVGFENSTTTHDSSLPLFTKGNWGTSLRKDNDWWFLLISFSVLHFLTHVVWTVIYLFSVFFFSLSLSLSLPYSPARRETEPTSHQQADTHVRLSLSHFENYPEPPTSPERDTKRERRERAGVGTPIPVCMCVLVYVSVCLW